MAHRITYKPSGILLSSAFGDVGVDVDGAFVDVTLTAPGNIVILSERYYAYGGRVTLYDLASQIYKISANIKLINHERSSSLYRSHVVKFRRPCRYSRVGD